MTVSRKKHLYTVYILGSIILLLGVVLLSLIWSFFPFFKNQILPPDAYVAQPYLKEEEIVVIVDDTADIQHEESVTVLPVETVLFQYVEVTDSCDIHYEGDCLLVRTGPGTNFPVVSRLRNHVVLKVDGKVERDGMTWYKIAFDEYLRYPERVQSDWYIAAPFVEVLFDEGDKTIDADGATSSQRIIVDRAEQMLYAYDGDELFMETSISTGLELSPTPRGTFTIFKKTPSRYMQGPLPGFTDTYDLPGVPWNLYFTHQGAVIHGTYWHDSFGSPYSHGCVNLRPEDARKLYAWAELGAKVIVQ